MATVVVQAVDNNTLNVGSHNVKEIKRFKK